MRVEYRGRSNAEVEVSWSGGSLIYNQVNSLQEVIDSDGETFWQDSANSRVWIKIKGGRENRPYDEYNFEASAYQRLSLDIYSN